MVYEGNGVNTHTWMSDWITYVNVTRVTHVNRVYSIHQQTHGAYLSLSVLGIESGRTWRSPHSIPKLSPYPQMHSSAMKVKTRKLPPCHNSLATALLVDAYQITMAYAYWKNGTHARIAAFDLLFRKNPFNGEFTVFAGLEECLRFISNFRFTGADIAFLRR